MQNNPSNKKISICFIMPQTYIYFNESVKGKGGGAEKIGYILSSELAKDPAFEINYSVADYNQPEKEIINSVILWKIKARKSLKFLKFIRFLKLLKKINSDIYVFGGSGAESGIANISARILLRKKTLYMLMHDSETSFNESRKIIGFAGAIVMAMAYRINNAITTQTEFQKELFTKSRNLMVKSIVRNIIDLTHIQSIENKSRDTSIWVCRCERWKQPELFLNLALRFKNEKFVMVCSLSSDKEYWHEIKEKANKICNIQFYDYLPNTELAEQYKFAKLFVNTSSAEGFSFAMMEAMAVNCSVLTYNANPDFFIDKYKTGYCANGNLNDFYTKFERLISSDLLLKETGNNARKYLEDYHSVPRIIADYKNLISDIVHEKK
jgi:glycosyltransferase involved in cell wall biosynthesis